MSIVDLAAAYVKQLMFTAHFKASAQVLALAVLIFSTRGKLLGGMGSRY